MLVELRIAGLGVIEDAAIEFGRGLTVVTGETGAGKTMVVTALGLAAGGRADANRVRGGAVRASVEARFAPPDGSAVADLAREAGAELDDDDSLIVARTISADGRSRAHVGGRSVPLATLTKLTEPLVTIHGQSQAISLLRPAHQRAVLDRYAATSHALAVYRNLRTQWQAARRSLVELTAASRERAEREQVLQLGIAEIQRVAPVPGEEDDLQAEVRRLQNADDLRAAAAQAQALLSGNEVQPETSDATALLSAARKVLEHTVDPQLSGVASALREATVLIADAAAELSGYLDALDADPARLQTVLERQAALRTLTRRYGADTAAVLDWADSAHTELAALDSSEEKIAELRSRKRMLGEELAKAGLSLSEQRRAAAERLQTAATKELARLAMERASLQVAVRPQTVDASAVDAVAVGGQWYAAGPDGFDAVEILLRSHADAPELPLQKGASGGELSRVMLALEVVLAEADPVSTLLFDEVDAGVGGRAAAEVGALLAELATTHQVLVVTHLAQVAAFADRHLVVDATEDGSVRVSSVRPVTGEERQAELARMLGGTTTPTARQHAADLLAHAAQRQRTRRTARLGQAAG